MYAKNRIDAATRCQRSVCICDRKGRGVVPNVKRIFESLERVATVVFVKLKCYDSDIILNVVMIRRALSPPVARSKTTKVCWLLCKE